MKRCKTTSFDYSRILIPKSRSKCTEIETNREQWPDLRTKAKKGVCGGDTLEVGGGRGDETGLAGVTESTAADDKWAVNRSGGDASSSGKGREDDES